MVQNKGTTKKPRLFPVGALSVKSAATYSPTFCSAVPSAQEGLTSLFGMGRGGTPPLKPPEDFKYRDMLVNCKFNKTFLRKLTGN
jgi:hypothetical protein